MTMPALWNGSWPAALVNHLWQSTVVLGVAWVLAVVLRKNSARARYWVWMAASVKFLLPFSCFVAAGEWVHSRMPAPVISAPVAAAAVVEQLSQPFSGVEFASTSAPASAHQADMLPWLLLAAWLCGVLVVAARWASGWLRIHAALRKAVPAELPASEVPAFTTAAQMEPGVFGIFRPVLLLPEGIGNRLTPAQLNAVVAHEMCHVRRRDNLMFAVHMAAEAAFWFYPAVWWIGSRLLDERERACDEAVVLADCAAEIYAQGILNVCKYCIESPLACVSGVAGADLKLRIARIMKGSAARKLDFGRRLALGAAGFAVLIAPIAMGLMHSAQIRAQLVHANGPLPSFEVATIKPSHDSKNNFFSSGIRPAEFTAQNISLARLIRVAYSVKAENQVQDMPGWADTERFDIDAKIPNAEVAKMEHLPPEQRFEQYQLMIQSLLADRFMLRVSTREENLPVYALVVDKSGEKMQSVAVPQDPLKQRPGEVRLIEKSGEMNASAISMERFCQWLSGTPEAGDRPVIDSTGLTNRYSFTLRWAPIAMAAPAETGSNKSSEDPAGAFAEQNSGPSLFTAVESQLGLKLLARKAPVEILVIKQLEQPSAN
jgi:bla regulator protein BlaR1